MFDHNYISRMVFSEVYSLPLVVECSRIIESSPEYIKLVAINEKRNARAKRRGENTHTNDSILVCRYWQFDRFVSETERRQAISIVSRICKQYGVLLEDQGCFFWEIARRLYSTKNGQLIEGEE